MKPGRNALNLHLQRETGPDPPPIQDGGKAVQGPVPKAKKKRLAQNPENVFVSVASRDHDQGIESAVGQDHEIETEGNAHLDQDHVIEEDPREVAVGLVQEVVGEAGNIDRVLDLDQEIENAVSLI